MGTDPLETGKQAVAPVVAQAKAMAGDRRTQIIIGVALLAFGGGLYLGLKLRGPQEWVESIEPKPCADCADKAKQPEMRTLTAGELEELASLIGRGPATPAGEMDFRELGH